MEQNRPVATGNLKISEEVVSTIAKQVITETEGVYSLAPQPVSLKDTVLKAGIQKPVKITLNSDVAVIDIGVILKMGYKVKDIAEKIQNDIKEEVQNMTGITVSAVNIYVADATNKSKYACLTPNGVRLMACLEGLLTDKIGF